MIMSAAFAKIRDVYFGTFTQGKDFSKGIYHSRLDLETGTLSPAVLAAETDNPNYLIISPTGAFLYCVSELHGIGSINSYRINRDTGALKFLNQQPSGGIEPCHLCTDHTGKILFAANYTSGSISVFPLKADGTLAELSYSVRHSGSSLDPQRQTSPHVHSINISPDGRFIFGADLGIDKVMIYKLNAAGTLSPNNPAFVNLKPGAGPRHTAFHPAGKSVYVINELDSTIAVFNYHWQSGELENIQTIKTIPNDYSGNNYCAEIAVHPSGKFLYGSNRGHNSIAVYRITSEAGKLEFLGYELTDIKTPRHFSIDPAGKFCLIANQDSDSVVVFRIDPESGMLTPTGYRAAVPRPVCVRFL